MKCRRRKIIIILFSSAFFCTFVSSRVITLEQSNDELRNTNGCYLVTQFSSNPTNRFILKSYLFLQKLHKKDGLMKKNKKLSEQQIKVRTKNCLVSRQGSSIFLILCLRFQNYIFVYANVQLIWQSANYFFKIFSFFVIFSPFFLNIYTLVYPFLKKKSSTFSIFNI